jgi:hypothetical protein
MPGAAYGNPITTIVPSLSNRCSFVEMVRVKFWVSTFTIGLHPLRKESQVAGRCAFEVSCNYVKDITRQQVIEQIMMRSKCLTVGNEQRSVAKHVATVSLYECMCWIRVETLVNVNAWLGNACQDFLGESEEAEMTGLSSTTN